MDNLTAQERQLIMTLRHLRSFLVIVHGNERRRIVVADMRRRRMRPLYVGSVTATPVGRHTSPFGLCDASSARRPAAPVRVSLRQEALPLRTMRKVIGCAR
jgi:hypothetical protein